MIALKGASSEVADRGRRRSKTLIDRRKHTAGMLGSEKNFDARPAAGPRRPTAP
jgi:hypothetical protein